MSTYLAILSDPLMFDEGKRKNGKPGYNPYYRFVICRAIWELIRFRSHIKQQIIHNLLNQAINCFTTSGQVITDLFEIFSFNYSKKQGFVVVDKTNGCYPLVLYPDRPEKDKRARGYAFCESLIDVQNKLALVLNLQASSKGVWTPRIRSQLLGILPSP